MDKGVLGMLAIGKALRSNPEIGSCGARDRKAQYKVVMMSVNHLEAVIERLKIVGMR